MVQVVTNENIQQLIETRQVPQFKAPPAASPEETAKMGELKVTETTVTAEPREVGKDPARDLNTGKFVKADGEKSPKDEAEKSAETFEGLDPEDLDLPERVKRQMGKKHRLMKEAEEFGREEYRARKAAEDRAAALEHELTELKSKSGPKPEKGADAPKPEDFKTVAEYADALTDYLLEKKLAAREAKSKEVTQAQAIQNAQQAFGERVAAVAKDIPDYYEVVEAADVEVPPHIASHIVESGDVGVRLGYHLAKHPDVLDRIKKLSPIRAIAELGKLETQLEKKPEAKADATPAAAPAVSRAPAPITPLEGKTTPVAKDPSQMTFQELRAYRQAERAAGKR